MPQILYLQRAVDVHKQRIIRNLPVFQYVFIIVDLQKLANNKAVDAVLTTSFSPGVYVKTFYLENFTSNGDLKQLNCATDPLYKIMQRCANVRRVSFFQSESAGAKKSGPKEWLYFTSLLLQNTTWKLQDIRCPYDNDLCYPYYYNCAYYMGDSLMELHLENCMIGCRDYKVLSEFKQLKKLYIGVNMLKNYFDCAVILRYLPQLTDLLVDGFQRYDDL